MFESENVKGYVKYPYEDNQLNVDSMLYNGRTKGENDIGSLLGEENASLKSLEDSSAGLLSSLMGPDSRTPLDLIQADFPSTPSTFFSQSRFIAGSNDPRFEQKLDKLDELNQEDPLTGSNFTSSQQPIFSSEDDQNRQRAGSMSQLRNNPRSQQQPQQPAQAPTAGQQQQQTPPQQPQQQQQAPFPPGQMPMMPQMQYLSIDPNTGAPIPGAQPQGGYYVPQPVFFDQNGQPVYYRQEIMYAPGPDGNPVEQMMAFLPYPPNGQQFWMNPSGMPEQGGPMFMNQNGGHMVPENSRGGRGYGGQQGFGSQQGGRNSGNSGYSNPRHDPIEQMGVYPVSGSSNPGGRHGKERGERNGMHSNPRGERGGRGAGAGAGGSNRQGNGAVNPMRDTLVDEFRSTYGKTRQWELIDLIGHVVAFCQDQHGSRFIQQRLEVCTEVDKQLIFDEIAPSAHSLMTDVFGNYVLQKLFEYGTPEQCETLAMLLSGQAVILSMQMYGCRVVQKALEYVNTQRLITIVGEFENPQVLLRCVHDSNGNHVIQKCIEIVSKAAKEASTPEMSEFLSNRIMFIINAFQGRVKELSSHPYGCRVVQRILEHCSSPQKAIVLEELRKCCAELVQDCYGNYVIQFVMQHGWDADRAVLIKEVQAHLLDFSQHKFASNVVEKCLQYANKRDRDEMIWAIINVTFDLNNPVDAKTGHCVLESMVRDPYANYVVQKVIDVSDERQRAAIVRYVKENIVQLRRYTYGKHIIVRLEKITNDKF